MTGSVWKLFRRVYGCRFATGAGAALCIELEQVGTLVYEHERDVCVVLPAAICHTSGAHRQLAELEKRGRGWVSDERSSWRGLRRLVSNPTRPTHERAALLLVHLRRVGSSSEHNRDKGPVPSHARPQQCRPTLLIGVAHKGLVLHEGAEGGVVAETSRE